MRSTNLANEFAQNGYRSTILVTKEIAGNIFFERNKNVNIVSLNKYISEHSDNALIKKIVKKRRIIIRLLKYLRYISRFFPEADRKLVSKIKGLKSGEAFLAFTATNPDCIYIPFGLGYFEATYSALHKKSSIVYAERTTPLVEFPKTEFEKKQIIKKLKKADHVILQTKNSFDFYKTFGVKATVINNPIKANLPDVYNGERRKCIVNFCRISSEKNLPLLFEAFIEFHKTHPDYTLEIYGNTVEQHEEELKQNYIKMISSLNAEAFIKILLPREDVHSIVRDCAMFVSSSDFEGLSNSMIEAMAIGLPCVCTDCLGGGAREVITDGENGLIVPAGNAEELCAAMCRLADNKELSKKCSENAQKIKTDLSVKKTAAKWLKILEQI